jgi:hypothetical protein
MPEDPMIAIPHSLYERASAAISRLGFSSVEEYVAHVLREHLSTVDHDEAFTESEEEEVKDRLRALGYLD